MSRGIIRLRRGPSRRGEYVVWARTGIFAHPKYHTSDTVRLCEYRTTFSKRYTRNFIITQEICTINAISHGDPNMYHLVDHDGDSVIGNQKKYEEKKHLMAKSSSRQVAGAIK